MKPRRPFSIVRRILALVVGVSIVTMAIYLVSLFFLLRPVVDDVALHMLSQVRTVELALRAMPAQQRDGFAAAIGSEAASVGRARPVASGARGDRGDQLPPPLLSRLEAGLGRKVNSVVAREGGGALKASLDMPVGDETWWLTLSVPRPSIVWTLVPILGSVALVGLAASLALVLGVRLITRPMSRLAEDMLARRNQLRKIDEPLRSSVELQGVIRSFNALVAGVELSERSRHDLLAGVSHDLRTPLARLRLRAETECPDDVAAKMEADFLALSRIIDQFLAYAQGQNGVATGAIYPLSELVGAMVDQYRADGVDVSFLHWAGAELAVPDVGVQRVVTNLIDNALAHGRGSIEVALTLDDSEVVLMVFDQGQGIPQASFENALRPFVRLGAESSTEGHCGLGLAIVAQVAGQLGGRAVLSPFDGMRSGVGVRLPA